MTSLGQTALVFKNHLEKYDLTGFGGYAIKTYYHEDGSLKKKMGISIKDWAKVVKPDNWEKYLLSSWTDKDTGNITYSQPKSFYLKTGKEEGIVGIDFDTKPAYDAFVKANPECLEYLTQKTKKGFHIIFKYDSRFSHSCSNDGHEREECRIDFRSDGGCLISYPTKYYHHETNEEYSYDIHIDGKLGTITDKIVKYFDDNNIVYYKLKTDTGSKMNKKKKEIKAKIEKQIDEVEDQLEEMNSQSGQLFKRLCACYTKDRVASYSSWFEMGCMLKNHFFNKQNDKEGLECFKYFSQLKDEDGKLFYPSYSVEGVYENWAKMTPYKCKKADKNKSWDKIKKWAKKDNEEVFNAIFDISSLNLTSSYTDLKTAFEETNFKVRNPVGFCEVVEIDGQEELVFRSKNELSVLYENLLWTKYEYVPPKEEDGEGTWETEERCFVDDWRKDGECLTYERVDFRPYCLEDTSPDNIYNQFRGFNALKYYKEWLEQKEGYKRTADEGNNGIGLLLQHIKDLTGNEEAYKYFLDWLAFKVQFPNRKNNIAEIIKSVFGCGKDSFFDWFGNEILGSKYYLNIQGLNQLENFNALLSGKLLVVLNEFELKESISNKEKFKALITNVVNVINEKHEKQRKEKDYTNYALLTNNTISFSVETGDRRITATESNSAIANNKEYFDRMYKYIYGKDKNGEYVGKSFIAPFFHFLLQRKVENKDWIGTRPQTEYYKTLQEYSISPLVRFFEYLNNLYVKHGNNYNGKADNVYEEKSVFSATNFYQLFKEFRTEWNYKSADWNSVLFGTNLKQYCVNNKQEANDPVRFLEKKKSSVNIYILDNKKMIKYLESQGIIDTNGVCLLKLKNDDEIEEEM
jgi:hypothetical protein